MAQTGPHPSPAAWLVDPAPLSSAPHSPDSHDPKALAHLPPTLFLATDPSPHHGLPSLGSGGLPSCSLFSSIPLDFPMMHLPPNVVTDSYSGGAFHPGHRVCRGDARPKKEDSKPWSLSLPQCCPHQYPLCSQPGPITHISLGRQTSQLGLCMHIFQESCQESARLHARRMRSSFLCLLKPVQLSLPQKLSIRGMAGTAAGTTHNSLGQEGPLGKGQGPSCLIPPPSWTCCLYQLGFLPLQ